tara:strand:- start:1915 stop:2094 length:180 start_codon:yes stop_codon:yes gene_type:complete
MPHAANTQFVSSTLALISKIDEADSASSSITAKTISEVEETENASCKFQGPVENNFILH